MGNGLHKIARQTALERLRDDLDGRHLRSNNGSEYKTYDFIKVAKANLPAWRITK